MTRTPPRRSDTEPRGAGGHGDPRHPSEPRGTVCPGSHPEPQRMMHPGAPRSDVPWPAQSIVPPKHPTAHGHALASHVPSALHPHVTPTRLSFPIPKPPQPHLGTPLGCLQHPTWPFLVIPKKKPPFPTSTPLCWRCPGTSTTIPRDTFYSLYTRNSGCFACSIMPYPAQPRDSRLATGLGL